jgi:hypothetical protein
VLSPKGEEQPQKTRGWHQECPVTLKAPLVHSHVSHSCRLISLLTLWSTILHPRLSDVHTINKCKQTRDRRTSADVQADDNTCPWHAANQGLTSAMCSRVTLIGQHRLTLPSHSCSGASTCVHHLGVCCMASCVPHGCVWTVAHPHNAYRNGIPLTLMTMHQIPWLASMSCVCYHMQAPEVPACWE